MTHIQQLYSKVMLAVISSSLLGCDLASHSAGSESLEASTEAKTEPKSSIAIAGWGPAQTKVGTPFNVQPGGHSAFWIAIEGLALSSSNYVKFGSNKITVLNQEPSGVTFNVPSEAYEFAGDKKVSIFEAETGRTIDVGTFKVLPAN